jgi:hypothetical protein
LDGGANRRGALANKAVQYLTKSEIRCRALNASMRRYLTGFVIELVVELFLIRKQNSCTKNACNSSIRNYRDVAIAASTEDLTFLRSAG